MTDEQAPPIAGAGDGYDARVRGDKLTAEVSTRSRKRLDAGREPIEDSPLFGGPRQREMFPRVKSTHER
ncbi:hypothetical protein LCGC14_2414610 [marine sediment metagenome]|uniref:Uncharacterized protein n=1 Tax=marine sediment metagenome TaxID=412755 RepID=A0A0F9E3N0_9ZZZZ